MKPIYRNSIIALLILAGLFGAFKLGQLDGEVRANRNWSKFFYEYDKDIREKNARKNLGKPSLNNADRPPISK